MSVYALPFLRLHARQHISNIDPHPFPGQSRKYVYVYWFFYSQEVGVSQKGSRERCLPVFISPENETEENRKKGRKREKTEKNRNLKRTAKKEKNGNGKDGRKRKKKERKKTEENGRKRKKTEKIRKRHHSRDLFCEIPKKWMSTMFSRRRLELQTWFARHCVPSTKSI